MKLVIALLILSSITTLAANKVVQKTRVLEEQVVSAEGCSVTGEYTNESYATEYLYTAKMKVSVRQKVETYSVNVIKSLGGKIKEVEVNNSTKEAPEQTVATVHTITHAVRTPTEAIKMSLLKACEDEMTFINTGSYPPPPPKPVIVEQPKKEPVKKPETDPAIPPVGEMPIVIAPELPIPGGEPEIVPPPVEETQP